MKQFIYGLIILSSFAAQAKMQRVWVWQEKNLKASASEMIWDSKFNRCTTPSGYVSWGIRDAIESANQVLTDSEASGSNPSLRFVGLTEYNGNTINGASILTSRADYAVDLYLNDDQKTLRKVTMSFYTDEQVNEGTALKPKLKMVKKLMAVIDCK